MSEQDQETVKVDGPSMSPHRRELRLQRAARLGRSGPGGGSTPWLWFTSAEPAYAYGRALRMAGSISSWDMNRAALEVRFDETAPGIERRKLYIDWRPAPERFDDDDSLLVAFTKGVASGSSRWPHQTDVDHHARESCG